MLIKNGTIMNPASQETYIGDIYMENGIIRDIIRRDIISKDCADTGNLSDSLSDISGRSGEIIDATGLIVSPGLIDTHVHFRDPGFTYKEDLHTGALAAAAGGFTSVICMANTKPAVDSVEVLADILNRAASENIHIYQSADVTMGIKGCDLVPMEELRQAGACGFTDDGIPIMNDELLREAMEKAAQLDLPISLHEEDPQYIINNGINAGRVSKALGIQGSPALAEESMVKRDCIIATEIPCDLVIQHISSGKSVDYVRQARAAGAKIHAEATPHHFSLTEDAVLAHGSLAKMNPPLRTEADRQLIIEGLKDGTIDLIATDHAPHSTEEKSRELTQCPSGIIGLETSLALGVTNLVKPGHLTMMELLEKMTINPARLYKLNAGTIAPGVPADITIISPDEKWTPTEYQSKSSNTPFTGMELTGRVRYTICSGEVVYRAI